jgi:hypothetical protein
MECLPQRWQQRVRIESLPRTKLRMQSARWFRARGELLDACSRAARIA